MKPRDDRSLLPVIALLVSLLLTTLIVQQARDGPGRWNDGAYQGFFDNCADPHRHLDSPCYRNNPK